MEQGRWEPALWGGASEAAAALEERWREPEQQGAQFYCRWQPGVPEERAGCPARRRTVKQLRYKSNRLHSEQPQRESYPLRKCRTQMRQQPQRHTINVTQVAKEE